MAVRIPRLNRIQPSGPEQTGRVNFTPVDPSALTESRTRLLSTVADAAFKYQISAENSKIKTLSQEFENEYSQFVTGHLNTIKNYEGDPTNLSREFEDQEREFTENYISEESDLSERVKDRVRRNINKYQSKYRPKVLTTVEGKQQLYKDNLLESNIKLNKRNLIDSTALIDPNEESTYKQYEATLKEMEENVLVRGIEKGTVVQLADDAEDFDYEIEDPDGNPTKVKLTSISKYQLGSVLSDSVSSSIETAIISGNVELARDLKKRYGSYVDERTLAKLDNKEKQEDIKKKALNIVRDIQYKSHQEQVDTLNNIKDPELNIKASNYLDSLKKTRVRREETQQKVIYNSLNKKINALMSSQNPPNSIVDLESDPEFSLRYNDLSPKYKKALEKTINPPATSKPRALENVQELYLSERVEDILEIPEDQIDLFLSDLNTKDRRYYRKIYTYLTGTGQDNIDIYRDSGTALKRNLLRNNVIRLDQKTGKVDARDLDVYQSANKEFLNWITTQKGDVDDKDADRKVKEILVEQIKMKVRRPKQPSGIPQQETTAQQSTFDVMTLPPGKRIDYKDAFQEIYGRRPLNTDPAFRAFTEEQERELQNE